MKVIFLDYGVFMHRAIFAWRNSKAIPPTYTALSMMIANLKRIGVSPEDLIIVAIDSPAGSWRREIDKDYKANRKAKRDEQKDIDWDKMFGEFNRLKTNLEISTPFAIIEITKLEADDIISYGVRYYKDKCVVVSTDTDFEQLAILPNVKLFSPITKRYKTVINPQFIVSKKINRETTDNLVSPIVSEEDYIKRNLIVDLMHLPTDVEEKVQYELSKISPAKEFDLSQLWYKSIRNKFMDIYNSNIIVSEEVKPKRKKKGGKSGNSISK